MGVSTYYTPKLIELIPDKAGPLGNITEQALDKESNEGNKIKTEPTRGNGETAEQNIEPLITPNIPVVADNFPDATQNLLVPLPPDTELDFMDATLNTQTENSQFLQMRLYPHLHKENKCIAFPVRSPCTIFQYS